MTWKWKDGQVYLATAHEIACKLLLTEGCNSESTKFTQIECTETFHTLGVHLSPSGDTRAARDILRGEAVSFARKMTSLSYHVKMYTGHTPNILY
jgi:hypothetical protein